MHKDYNTKFLSQWSFAQLSQFIDFTIELTQLSVSLTVVTDSYI